MSMPQGGERPGAPPRTVEDRHRENGLNLLRRLTTLIRLGRAYQIENQVVQRQLEDFLGIIAPMLAETGEVVLVFIDSDFYLNGIRIPVKASTVKFHEGMMHEFEQRKIAGIKLVPGIKLEELNAFVALFLKPDVFQGTGLLEACVAHGCDHILPAVHATTESPDSGGESGTMTPMEKMSLIYAGLSSSRSANDLELSDPSAGLGVVPSGAAGSSESPRGAAPKSFSQAMVGARSLLTTTTLQGGLEMRHAKRVVQPLVDGAFAKEPVVVGLTTLGRHDEYTYAHAVNVTLVAVTMGHYLQMDRRALADLGAAALLHDVGKAAVANEIKNRLEDFTEEERAAAARHPLEGARLLAESTALNATTLRCMRVAMEHHANADGSGYPALPPRWRVSMLARLVAVADCFVSLQTHRSERGAEITPSGALGMMLGPLSAKFDPALLWALVQTVGFYPPGQLVELDDGSIAIVLAPNIEDLARPHVHLITGPKRMALETSEAVELRPIPRGMSVLRALKAEDYAEISVRPEAA